MRGLRCRCQWQPYLSLEEIVDQLEAIQLRRRPNGLDFRRRPWVR